MDTTKLNEAIKAKGYSITGFSEQVLDIQYRTFKTQLERQTLRLKDIHRILKLLDKTFEEIFPTEE